MLADKIKSPLRQGITLFAPELPSNIAMNIVGLKSSSIKNP